MSIVACSLVGGYCFTVAVDRYIGGTLAYVVFNVIRRAIDTTHSFSHVTATPPFKLNGNYKHCIYIYSTCATY